MVRRLLPAAVVVVALLGFLRWLGERQQELPGSRIAIDADLDRQQQIGDALDLVEHHRHRQPRYKTSGVAGRSVSRRLIVKRQDRSGLSLAAILWTSVLFPT